MVTPAIPGLTSQREEEISLLLTQSLKTAGFPIDDRIKRLGTAFENIDPLTYAVNDDGTALLQQTSLTLMNIGYSQGEADIFGQVVRGLMFDSLRDEVGKLLFQMAEPGPSIPIADIPPEDISLPPEAVDFVHGKHFLLWSFDDPLAPEDEHAKPQDFIVPGGVSATATIITAGATTASVNVVVNGVLIAVVPAWVAVAATLTLAMAALEGDFAGLWQRTVKELRRFGRRLKRVSRKLRKVFKW